MTHGCVPVHLTTWTCRQLHRLSEKLGTHLSPCPEILGKNNNHISVELIWSGAHIYMAEACVAGYE
jgi:hypothetical protein